MNRPPQPNINNESPKVEMPPWGSLFKNYIGMCQKSDTIAHDLFYQQDARRERKSPGGRFSIHRGKDYTVAYSYQTPIAVYPDFGDFVLLDDTWFSSTTRGHQSGIRQAVPYNVRCIECAWLGMNDVWYSPYAGVFKTQFKKFIRDIGQQISAIGKSDSDYAYSRERKETLNRLNGLRPLAEVGGMTKTLLLKIDRRIAAISDVKRIQHAQKRAAKQRADEKKRVQKIRQANQLGFCLNILFQTNEAVKQAVTHAAEQMLQRFPYPQWKGLPDALQQPQREETRQMLAFTRNAVKNAAESLWQLKHDPQHFTEYCDIRWHKDGLFRTTKGVNIHYEELQRCLALWRRRRLLGEMVANRYQVLRNDNEILIIGCHRFLPETVQRIWERYAGKPLNEIIKEETNREQECIVYIRQVMEPLLNLVQREFRNNNPELTTPNRV